MPTIPGGQKRLLFTGNVKTNLVNKYTAGSGVGALSASTRRLLKRRASAGRGTLDANGNLVPAIPIPCCSVELVASQKLPEPEQIPTGQGGIQSTITTSPPQLVTGTVNDELLTGTLSTYDLNGNVIESNIIITSGGEYVINVNSDYPDLFEIRTNDDCKDINTDEPIITQLSCIVARSTIDTITNSTFRSTNPIASLVSHEYKQTFSTKTLSDADVTISNKLGISKDHIYIDVIQSENFEVAMKQLQIASIVNNCKKLMSHDKDTDIMGAVVDEIKKQVTPSEELFDATSLNNILDTINKKKPYSERKTVQEVSSLTGILDAVNKDVKSVTNDANKNTFTEKYMEASKRKGAAHEAITDIENSEEKSYADFDTTYVDKKTSRSLQPVKPIPNYKIISTDNTPESIDGYNLFPYYDFKTDKIPINQIPIFWMKIVEWSSVHKLLNDLNPNITNYNMNIDSDTYFLNFTSSGKRSIPNYSSINITDSVQPYTLYIKTEFLTKIQESYDKLKPPEPDPTPTPAPAPAPEPAPEPAPAPAPAPEPAPEPAPAPAPAPEPAPEPAPAPAPEPAPAPAPEPAPAPVSIFNVYYENTTNISSLVFNTYVDIMNSAIAKWESVITGIKHATELPDYKLSLSVTVTSLPTGVLGGTGIYEYNTIGSTYGKSYPTKANIELSSSMIASLANDIREGGKSSLYYVFLHEVGHALGIGSFWSFSAILNRPIKTDNNGRKYYSSNNVLREYKNISAFKDFADTLIGIPLENDGGSGTSGVHLEEGNEGSISFDNRTLTVSGVTYNAPGLDQELMTGWAETNRVEMPLSRVTVALLDDLGYIVNYNNADPYNGPMTPSIPSSLTFNVSRGSSNNNINLTYNNLINNIASTSMTSQSKYYYVYGGKFYNVLGSMHIVNDETLITLPTNTSIDNNNSAELNLVYTPPSDLAITKETFSYTMFYQTPNGIIVQSNNCYVTINITG